jgi:sugar lactone lactonase YvrE
LAGAHEGFTDGTTQAAFNTPSGLAIDDAGNIYVADTGNNAIRKITQQGVVTTVAGDGRAGYRDGAANQARFNGPIGIAVDKGGNLYVADTYNDRIRVISPFGQVTTVAGGDRPGYRDGLAENALFDTPCALAFNAKGELLIADTRNNAIRVLRDGGQVSTLVRSLPEDRQALFRRPLGLAVTVDGFVYVGTMVRGRVFQISPSGEMQGLTGVDIDFPSGDNTELRLVQPSAIAMGRDGALFVSDGPTHSVRKIAPRPDSTTAAQNSTVAGDVVTQAVSPAMPPESPSVAFPWPVKPQYGVHEIVGTMGEVRGNDDGDSRDHFHAGLDVQANMGTAVLAVADGKVSDPLAAWGYGDLSEGLAIDTMSYIHMRVGRTMTDEVIDATRFTAVVDDSGKARVRVKRGTRFRVGDALGTINRMYHVHLEHSDGGAAVNPLTLGFKGFRDRIAPRIESIQLFDSDGRGLIKRRAGRVLAPRSAGDLSIVVDAFDQMDGNAARRRLGLYKVGYQILHPDGTPVPGYEQALFNLEFNQLPPDRDAVKIAYAEGSGETVHGSAATRFLYVVTNTMRNGHAERGSWRAGQLPRGDYLIRISAVDYAGNMATAGRDLPITLE